MFRTCTILSAAFAALFLSTARSAEAGFVSASLAVVQGEAVVLDLGAGAGAAPEAHARDLRPTQIMSDIDAARARPMGNFVPGGMSAPPRESTGVGASAAAAVSPVVLANLPMVGWLTREGRASLPPPLSTELFRPPRWIDC